jgi:hypothetical protein
MLPDFTEQGLLPKGIHRATLEEFEKRFVYFDRSDRRFRLFQKLRELYQQARRSGIVNQFFVVGSFVTSKPEPNDFDCILVLDSSIEGQNLSPIEYNMVLPRMARRLFGGDVVPVIEGTDLFHESLGFFQATRSHEPMGIVEIEL